MSWIAYIWTKWPILLDILLWKVRVILQYVIRYRSSVITNNLQLSFPDKSYQDLQAIKHAYYDTLTRYIKEVIFIQSWTKEKLKTSIYHPEISPVTPYLDRQKSIVLTASHYGNWEMNIVLLPLFHKQRVVAFYKPISNKYLDTKMLASRSKFGLELYPIDKTVRIMESLKNQSIIYIFIGDQSPLNMNHVFWNTFLNQRTPWLIGAEKLAKKFNYPIFYLHQKPLSNNPKNIFYQLDYTLLSDTPDQEEYGTITQKYTTILEKEIIEEPKYWLWSHKRWKRAHLFEA